MLTRKLPSLPGLPPSFCCLQYQMGEERRVDCVCTMTKVMDYGSVFSSLFSLLVLLIEKVQRADRLQTRGRDMAVIQGAELKKVLTSCSM